MWNNGMCKTNQLSNTSQNIAE